MRLPASLNGLLAGFTFSILWASASAATKIGLLSAQPFTIAISRFALASACMLVIAHLLLHKKLPNSLQLWKQLTIYGFLNISLYLGLYVLAMEEVSAGIGTLFVATNPVLITLISTVWYKQKVGATIWLSLFLCLLGVMTAAYPLIEAGYASIKGLLIMLLSMGCYSVGALYYSRKDWHGLHILTINAWQTLIGGVLLLPFFLLFYDSTANTFDLRLVGSVIWLALPVSIGAVLLWLYLLSRDTIKASFWLFLCPIAGFAIAAVLMKEPLSYYTLVGVILVLFGLYLTQSGRTATE